MKFLILLILLSFNISQATEPQCNLNESKVCHLDINEFMIGNIEFEDENLALTTYNNYCHNKIQQHIAQSNIRNFNFINPPNPLDFCSKFEKLYDVNLNKDRPHLFYLRNTMNIAVTNQARYFKKKFSTVINLNDDLSAIDSKDVPLAISSAFENCKLYVKEQMKISGVILSYCDDDFRGILFSAIGSKETYKDVGGLVGNFFDGITKIINKNSKVKTRRVNNTENIWQASVGVNAYTIVNKKFISNVKHTPLRSELFFTKEAGPKPTEEKNILEKISDAADQYYKFTQMFGRLVK